MNKLLRYNRYVVCHADGTAAYQIFETDRNKARRIARAIPNLKREKGKDVVVRKDGELLVRLKRSAIGLTKAVAWPLQRSLDPCLFDEWESIKESGAVEIIGVVNEYPAKNTSKPASKAKKPAKSGKPSESSNLIPGPGMAWEKFTGFNLPEGRLIDVFTAKGRCTDLVYDGIYLKNLRGESVLISEVTHYLPVTFPL